MNLGKGVLATLSLFLSVAFWLFVQTQIEAKPKTFTVLVEARNLPYDLVVTNPQDLKVELRAQGPPDVIDSINERDVRAYVDLRAATADKRSYLVRVERTKDRMQVEWDRKSIVLDLDQTAEKFLRIDAVPVGQPTNDNVLVEAVVEPSEIDVVGAARLVKQADRARVLFDFADIKPTGEPLVRKIEVLDQAQHTISGLTLAQQEAIVRITLAPKGQSRTLYVNPVLSGGQPAVGYRISKIVAIPPQIVFTGSSDSIARLSATTVGTEPIDLTGLAASKTFSVKLDLKGMPGVRPMRQDVRVRVEIEPIPGSSPARPQTIPGP